ncbi:hypothetical Protein YC6258_04528 [Gynuella sunshinyii YC6258]|uniref:Uncharacterized protein n=1 Tax=Gynuella sunshinyii YC6258 TaxID=1445510 RepID=A0A0C5VB37_9GAMM|nr:hypothetical Protein YC6258_04528 [Gynuella sunshinyii YC6258]
MISMLINVFFCGCFLDLFLSLKNKFRSIDKGFLRLVFTKKPDTYAHSFIFVTLLLVTIG